MKFPFESPLKFPFESPLNFPFEHGYSSSFVVSATACPLATLRWQFCSLLFYNRVLLANEAAFQVWQISSNSKPNISKLNPKSTERSQNNPLAFTESILVSANMSTCSLRFEVVSSTLDPGQKFIDMKNYDDTLIAATKRTLNLWDLAKGKTNEIRLRFLKDFRSKIPLNITHHWNFRNKLATEPKSHKSIHDSLS